MHDLRFYRNLGNLTLSDIAQRCGGLVQGDGSAEIFSVAPYQTASTGELCFFDGKRGDAGDVSEHCSGCITSDALAAELPEGVSKVVVDQPRAVFADVANWMIERRLIGQPQDDLGPTILPESATVSPGCVISDGVEIGEGSVLGPNVIIGPGVRIGRNCDIGAGTLIEASLIGNDVTIKANSVIGGSGFGLYGASDGLRYLPHFGRVIIQDRVGIGSFVSIDRGAMDDTVIGEGSKFDNHVHVGHNCSIGRNVIIAAFGGISGSVTIGDGARLGGRVGVSDHVEIGEGANVAGDSAVFRPVPPRETWGGSPARPLKQFFRELAWVTKQSRIKPTNRGD